MPISDLFLTRIDRDIKGVIKVGQSEDENVYQELDEYVVTRELARHFSDFFSSYCRSIGGQTDKMGVWISGFFGSGKSHFLKILSYLLENREVNDKHAIDYFKGKITDPIVLADMQRAGSVPTDTILFNIDSKSEATGKQSKDAIVSVFLRVFNEMQGFCGTNPYLADLERRLTEDGRYEEFQTAFLNLTHRDWTEARNDFYFIQDDLVDVLFSIGVMSREAARSWCEKAGGDYSIAIEDFAKMVKRYIDRCGDDRHVVFLADEIGQYIGDNSTLMLNLQTVTEDLGRICKGKAWVIVTSQQDIDSITRTKGNDFSKIQGRFDTRISLSSANVDEVIRKRILEKTPDAQTALAVLFDSRETDIRNKIVFNDGVEKKLYSNRDDFAAVYPFIPYQFNLMGSVLTAIRTHGASGKHLSEGERSMLGVFQDSAIQVMNDETGAVVPFYSFYGALERFLDHSHSSVITRAADNTKLEHPFDDNVLKTLFLIKYVKEVAATPEQITSLMVSNLDDDRLALKEHVEKALTRLTAQTLIQRSGNIYVFLTDEEQEINREIKKLADSIDHNEVSQKVGELIFDDIYAQRRYQSPVLGGRYQFPFIQMVDDVTCRSLPGCPLTMRILTPDSDEAGVPEVLRLTSGQDCCVLVSLPPDRSFLEELRTTLAIEQFIRQGASKSIAKYSEIAAAKQSEVAEHRANARTSLVDALKKSVIYVNGTELSSGPKDITARLNDAMGRLVSQLYYKLSYIDHPGSPEEIRKMLSGQQAQQVTMNDDVEKQNSLALEEVLEFIRFNAVRHSRTSMKTVLTRFMQIPYGFREEDVEWLVTRLFVNGDIALYMSSEQVTLLSKSQDELFRMLTRKEYADRLMLDLRTKATDRQKKAARDILKTVFHAPPSDTDEDSLMAAFQRSASSFLGSLEHLEDNWKINSQYPGKETVQAGKLLMKAVADVTSSTEFFTLIEKKKDDFLDFAEDYEPVRSFFSGEQRAVFDEAFKLMNIYDDSSAFVSDGEVDNLARDMKAILRKKTPWKDIYQLKLLSGKFRDGYDAILEDAMGPVVEAIDAAKKDVMDRCREAGCETEFKEEFLDKFEELDRKARSCNNISTLHSIPLAASATRTRLLEQIRKWAAAHQSEDNNNDGGDSPVTVTPQPKPVTRKVKTVPARSVIPSPCDLKTEADVDRFVEQLRSSLKSMLEDGTVLSIVI